MFAAGEAEVGIVDPECISTTPDSVGRSLGAFDACGIFS